MTSIRPLSGFPEYLPGDRMVEQRLIDILRENFELHGFAPVQTRSVEPLSQLMRKGEITQEVYVVSRLHAAAQEPDKLGLHFDLTVPFARYVLEHAGKLQFPFRRYQIQPAWRGERPQEGRYREFWQADIDIVGDGTLATHHDTEVVCVMLETLGRLHTELGLPQVLLHANNRKLIQGCYEALGIADPLGAIQVLDKLDKIGPDGVSALLREQGLTAHQITSSLQLAEIKTVDSSFVDQVRALGVSSELLDEGLAELTTLTEGVRGQLGAAYQGVPGGGIVADLRIARGLDYYTGSVFEVELLGHPSLGTISAGGRYDRLAADGKHTYPGVGISFGITRTLAPLLGAGAISASRSVPSAVLIAVDAEELRPVAGEVAAQLRARRIPCEVSPNAAKFGKQIRFADRRGIPFVWFGGVLGQVKDIRSGDQVDADATSWCPPEGDLWPQIGVTA